MPSSSTTSTGFSDEEAMHSLDETELPQVLFFSATAPGRSVRALAKRVREKCFVVHIKESDLKPRKYFRLKPNEEHVRLVHGGRGGRSDGVVSYPINVKPSDDDALAVAIEEALRKFESGTLMPKFSFDGSEG